MFIECEVLHTKTNKIYVFNFEFHSNTEGFSTFQNLENPEGFMGCYERIYEMYHTKTGKIFIFNVDLYSSEEYFPNFQDLENPEGFLGCYEKFTQ